MQAVLLCHAPADERLDPLKSLTLKNGTLALQHGAQASTVKRDGTLHTLQASAHSPELLQATARVAQTHCRQ